MRIVDLNTFLAMPEGTLFEKYEAQFTSDMGIKWARCGERDFVSQTLQLPIYDHNHLWEMENDSTVSHPVDLDCAARDGLFEDKQLFLVWEDADVQALIDRLTYALTLRP